MAFFLALVAALFWLFWFAFSPTHFLGRVEGTVKVDGHPVEADIFFWNAIDEADPIALVHLKDGQDYFLDLGTEQWRQGNPSEYVRVFGGAWSLRSMKMAAAQEQEQRLTRKQNEFYFPSGVGHEISVKF